MNEALLAIRIVLALVFFGAGLAKLFDLKGSQRAGKDFGLPQWVASPLGAALPVFEIAIAFLLIPTQLVWSGAIGALTLLLAFIVAIAINMALGRKPECHCFGQVHSKVIGWPTLARNLVLAVLAAFLMFEARTSPGPSILTLARNLSAAQIVIGVAGVIATAAIASLYWLVFHLFHQNGRLLLRIEALEINRPLTHAQLPTVNRVLPMGAKAVSFDLPTIDGARATLDDLLRGEKPLLLISTDPKCGPCNALMPEIAKWQRELSSEVTIALLSSGRLADIKTEAREHGLINLLVDENHKISEQYHAVGTPTAVLIQTDGTIQSAAASGPDRIRELIRHKTWTDAGNWGPQPIPQPKPSLTPGLAAPAFKLPDLSGDEFNSAQFNGGGTFLLFWNPACGFCQRMLPKLREWEATKQPDAPRLILISGGTPDANRAMGLESIVLMDDRFTVGRLYGASGTPSGLVVDSKGKIASALAVGEPKILSLLGGSPAPLNS
jgi:peroxiredoxin/uncharacterized membrane protein YphA (DoxX/SURF4 family)